MSRHEARYWDGIGERWIRRPPNPLWRAHSDAVNAALLARWLPAEPAGRALKTDLFDEAWGRGLADALASRARRVVGVDISASIVAEAAGRHATLCGAVADVRRLPFEGGSFDLVVSDSTLDHFATRGELAAALTELHRVLRPGGELLLTLDNPANPVVALRNALPFAWLHRLGVVPYQVGATCGPRALRRLLAGAGFDVVAADAVLHCPRVVAVAMARVVSRRGGAAAGGRFLRCLAAFESLRHLPTRYVTGHFTAVRAVKCAAAAATPRDAALAHTLDASEGHAAEAPSRRRWVGAGRPARPAVGCGTTRGER